MRLRRTDPTRPGRAYAASGAATGSPASTPTASPSTRRPVSGFATSPCRRPGRASGSAPTPTGTSRPSAPTMRTPAVPLPPGVDRDEVVPEARADPGARGAAAPGARTAGPRPATARPRPQPGPRHRPAAARRRPVPDRRRGVRAGARLAREGDASPRARRRKHRRYDLPLSGQVRPAARGHRPRSARGQGHQRPQAEPDGHRPAALLQGTRRLARDPRSGRQRPVQGAGGRGLHRQGPADLGRGGRLGAGAGAGQQSDGGPGRPGGGGNGFRAPGEHADGGPQVVCRPDGHRPVHPWPHRPVPSRTSSPPT